ncbi:Uncharacterised protein [Mycobacteroides abscessus subsp. abscessus]|nr:Uncharacterised protein [Mycobacteroides abscessus subsp. abscessus]
MAGLRNLQTHGGVGGHGQAHLHHQRQFLRCPRPEGRHLEEHRLHFPPGRLRRHRQRQRELQQTGNRYPCLRREAGALRRRRSLDGPGHHGLFSGIGARGDRLGRAQGLRVRHRAARGTDGQGSSVRRGQWVEAAAAGIHRAAQRPRPRRRPHRARLQVRHGRTHGLPGWQLHPGQPSRPLPRIGRRQGNRARRWQLLGHRAEARRRRHVGRLRLPQR